MIAITTTRHHPMNSNYKPTPIVTTGIEFPEELNELTEQLAEHIHDVWAKERMAQGWTYGKNRDDENKHHPCLVPYDDLPENEKTFDRATAMETLRAIVALGYRIEPPE